MYILKIWSIILKYLLLHPNILGQIGELISPHSQSNINPLVIFPLAVYSTAVLWVLTKNVL